MSAKIEKFSFFLQRTVEVCEGTCRYDPTNTSITFACVLELVLSEVGRAVTHSLGIPTIGIGAGPDCDAQVLVSGRTSSAYSHCDL